MHNRKHEIVLKLSSSHLLVPPPILNLPPTRSGLYRVDITQFQLIFEYHVERHEWRVAVSGIGAHPNGASQISWAHYLLVRLRPQQIVSFSPNSR